MIDFSYHEWKKFPAYEYSLIDYQSIKTIIKILLIKCTRLKMMKCHWKNLFIIILEESLFCSFSQQNCSFCLDQMELTYQGMDVVIEQAITM